MEHMNINIKKPRGVEVHVRVIVSKQALAELQRTPRKRTFSKPAKNYIRECTSAQQSI